MKKEEKGKKKKLRMEQSSETLRYLLEDVRIVQTNIIFVLGLPKQLSKPKIIQKHEFFGQYGKILKVKINSRLGFKNKQSVIIVYSSPSEAALAVLCANKVIINKKKVRVSLGMNKFCFNFVLRNQCKFSKCSFIHCFSSDFSLLRFRNEKKDRFDHISEKEVIQLLFFKNSSIEFFYSQKEIGWEILPNLLQLHKKLPQLEFTFLHSGPDLPPGAISQESSQPTFSLSQISQPNLVLPSKEPLFGQQANQIFLIDKLLDQKIEFI